MAKMFKDRRDEKDVQNDILQETFINTTAGWINLLLLSSSGPVKIPSVEIVCDTILSGKAKVMLAGGFDDLSEEGSYEFANMKATSNAETEFAMGREPTEMSRPASQPVQASWSLRALDGSRARRAPIRGIVAFTSTSTDKAGRSIPAPGRVPHPPARVPWKQISQWLTHEHYQLQEEIEFRKQEGAEFTEEELAARVDSIEKEAARQEKDALAVFGMLEGSDPRVAPLRRALAVWGLTTDDVGVLSIHGTSTGANEKNETQIWNDIFKGLSRTPGNAVPIMAQKSLLDGRWRGLLQSVYHGIIPGNRNGGNIDPMFQDRHFLMFPSKIYTAGIKAGLMSCGPRSFGFGQVGGTVLILHPGFHWQVQINSTVKQDTANVKAVSELLSSGGLSESAIRVCYRHRGSSPLCPRTTRHPRGQPHGE
ncbi:hypothetical protein EV715DRAFT_297105 [Schizophyllum commune]